jgi:hypothetical protein
MSHGRTCLIILEVVGRHVHDGNLSLAETIVTRYLENGVWQARNAYPLTPRQVPSICQMILQCSEIIGPGPVECQGSVFIKIAVPEK